MYNLKFATGGGGGGGGVEINLLADLTESKIKMAEQVPRNLTQQKSETNLNLNLRAGRDAPCQAINEIEKKQPITLCPRSCVAIITLY